MRASAGHPSYAEIVRLVAERRVAQGVPAARARPARTTVYGVFREGRIRVDAGLVGEIAGALGASGEEVAGWEARCRAARTRTESRGQQPPVEPGGTDVPAPTPAAEALPTGMRVTTRVRWIVLAACVAVNLVGRGFVDLLGLPLFLDMTGTATAAILLGPWWGPWSV
ncbi:MAG: hypothetical protein Q8Q02_16490 [Nocardioides sp.]|nr:hypothetical protein [Nocardioides sp.]